MSALSVENECNHVTDSESGLMVFQRNADSGRNMNTLREIGETEERQFFTTIEKFNS